MLFEPFATWTLASLFTITVAIIKYIFGATLRLTTLSRVDENISFAFQGEKPFGDLRPTENGTLPQAAYADKEDELDLLDIIIYIYIFIVANNWLFLYLFSLLVAQGAKNE